MKNKDVNVLDEKNQLPKLKENLKYFQYYIYPQLYKKYNADKNNLSGSKLYNILLKYLKQKYEDVIIYKIETDIDFYINVNEKLPDFYLLIKDSTTKKYNLFAIRYFFPLYDRRCVDSSLSIRTVKWENFFKYKVDEFLPIFVKNDSHIVSETLGDKIHKIYKQSIYEKYCHEFKLLFEKIFENILNKNNSIETSKNHKRTHNIHISIKEKNQYTYTISVYPHVKGYKKPDKRISARIENINNMGVLEIYENQNTIVTKKIKFISVIIENIDNNKKDILELLKKYEDEINQSKSTTEIQKLQSNIIKYFEEGKNPIEYIFTYLSYKHPDMFGLFKQV